MSFLALEKEMLMKRGYLWSAMQHNGCSKRSVQREWNNLASYLAGVIKIQH